MDTVGGENGHLPREAAERIVGFLSNQDGVRAVTVTSPGGLPIASSLPEAETDASLAAFICERAEELTAEGDLRGMGKLLSDSVFQELTISGQNREEMVVCLDGGCLLVSLDPFKVTSAVESVAPVVKRFGRPIETR